tara:strand:- start:218 stop:400 length:183 start_codon:yes stop_codon:yes gene_type:complete
MSREEMENAIIRNYVDVIKNWVNTDNDSALEEHVAESVYCNFKSMDLADIQADYEEIGDE